MITITTNWIKEISMQRKTLFSNGIIVQTEDPLRIKELKDTIKAKYPEPIILKLREGNGKKKWIEEKWLILDGWEGFLSFNPPEKPGEEWKTKKIEDSQGFGGMVQPLLKAVSEELHKKNRVLIVQNLLNAEDALNRALRSWSLSTSIRAVKSTIIVFSEDIQKFPEQVWSNMKTVDVPKATEEERHQMIEAVRAANKNAIKQEQTRSLVRLLAGMNKNQIDASLIESLQRYQELDLDAIARIKTEMLGKDPALEIIQRPRFGFDAHGSYKAVKERIIHEIVIPMQNPKLAEEYGLQSPRGMLLHGPPGTGKTWLTKTMGREVNMSVLLFRPANVLSKYVGESERAVNKIFRIADNMAPCIFMTDELDRLGKRGGNGSDAGSQVHREIFSMLLEKLGDRDRKWFFVGCTNRIWDIDEALRRTGRVDSCIPMPFPNREGREEIFKIHTTKIRKLPLDPDIRFDILADDRHTLLWSGSDIEDFIIKTAREVFNNAVKKGKGLKPINMDDFENMLKKYRVDVDANRKLQEQCRRDAERLTNDRSLMSIFEEEAEILTESGDRLDEYKKYRE